MTTISGTFYASIRRATATGGFQSGLLAGPFDTQEEAEAILPAVINEAHKVDPATHFDLFGTCQVHSIYGTAQPVGRLNARLGLSAPADTTIATIESNWRQHG